MNKNTGTRTATTFTLPAAMYDGWDAETKAELMKPSVWTTEEGARQAVERLSRWHLHTVNFAPGLEVHAFYEVCPLTGQRHLVTIIVFEDRTAARLHRAVRKAQPVTVSYVKADGEETVRTVEPTALKTTKAGDVIVQAVDRTSAETRSFRLDRITAYTIHRTAFTARTGRPAPTKAQLWEQWLNRPAADGVEVLDNLTGEIKVIAREAYDRLMSARDPREPKAADERLRESLSTTPGTADALEAPEAVQDALADAYARGLDYVTI